MSRNLKRDYLKKLSIMEKNGYKIDLANYIYNPAYGYDYPAFHKSEKDGDKIRTTRFYYFKHYDGSGEYIKEVSTTPDNGQSWNVSHTESEEILQTSNRFSLKTLESLVI